MSPQLNNQPQIRAAHAQRPWRPIEHEQRRPARVSARTYCAAVVRELPPRREFRAGYGTW